MTALTLLVVLAALVAWWGARRARGAADFFAAGHAAGAWLVGLAGTAAALSAFTFVGGPGLFFTAGTGALWLIASAPVTGALQCWAVGEPVVALVRRTGAVTLPELLGAHAGSRTVRAAAAVVIAVGCVASLAVQVRAVAVLGPIFLGVSGAAAAGLVMLATTLYMALGGMRAGLVADAVQGAVMAGAAVALAVASVAAAGGPAAAVGTLARAKPELLGAFGTLPPGRALALFLLFCVGTCAQPHYVQKFLFLEDARQLRLLPAVLTLALALTLTVWIGVGLGGTALVVDGRIAVAAPDDLSPRTMEFLGPWAVVLAGAGVLAAMMSTAASLMNLSAAALARDLPAALGRAPSGLAGARLATLAVAAGATGLGLGSERTVALLGIAGWGFFTAALLPALTVGLAFRVRAGALTLSMATGAAIDLVLETLRSGLPPGLEPGLAGAAAALLVLVAARPATLAQPRQGPEVPGTCTRK